MVPRLNALIGMIRINFQPYNTAQLETIVHARLAKSREGLAAKAPEVISKDGVKFASMKVSSISGDARRVLDICRYVHTSINCSKRLTRFLHGKEDGGTRSASEEDSRDEGGQRSHFSDAELSYCRVPPGTQSPRKDHVGGRPQVRQERGSRRSQMGRRETRFLRLILNTR